LDNKDSPLGNCFTATYPEFSNILQSPVELESSINPGERLKFTALWDTGATNSLIRPEVAQALRLLSISMTTISTPTSKNEPSHIYLVNIYLPNYVSIANVQVVEGIPGGCDMLIGMDIIGLVDFAVTNYKGHTTFSFRMPSMDEIDFVKHSYLLPETKL
jgi:predicted aspartyl protease